MPAIAVKRRSRVKKTAKINNRRLPASKRTAAGVAYDAFKEFEGRSYTGMKIGRSHKWYYDKGEWKEVKITPDLWEISYVVTKRRAGHAPKGSGVPVGSGYHWYILAHQNVEKLNADDYSTFMSGFKYKLAHKRAGADKWSATAATQRKHLIKFLKDMIAQLEEKPVPLELEYNGTAFKGEAMPVKESCHDGACLELEVNLNGSHTGIIRRLKSGWKMNGVDDQKFVDAIGNEIARWYE